MMRRSLLVVLTTLSTLSCAASAVAQDARILDRRLVTAVRRRDSVSRALTDYQASHPRAAYADTIAIAGTPLKVLATRGVATMGREAASIASERIMHRFGANATQMAPMTFYVRGDSTEWGNGVMTGQLKGKDEVMNRGAQSTSGLADAFVLQAQEALLQRVDSAFRLRIGGGLPIDTITDDQWATIRATLATSYSPLAHRCLEQEIAACEKILRVVPVVDEATELFDPAGRRATVALINYWNNVDLAAQEDCRSGNDEVCATILRRDHSNLVIGGQGVASLASEAFALGKDGALERLLKARGSEREILEATAGQPVDSIVARWAQKVRDRGTASTVFSPVIALVAIGWAAAFFLLALRSGRWR